MKSKNPDDQLELPCGSIPVYYDETLKHPLILVADGLPSHLKNCYHCGAAQDEKNTRCVVCRRKL